MSGGPEVPIDGLQGEVLTKLDSERGYGGATGWRPVAALYPTELEERVTRLEGLVARLQGLPLAGTGGAVQ